MPKKINQKISQTNKTTSRKTTVLRRIKPCFYRLLKKGHLVSALFFVVLNSCPFHFRQIRFSLF
jgi:hypothetical protein